MNIAIIGATGAVGREMLLELGHFGIKSDHIGLFASERSKGVVIQFQGQPVEVSAFNLEKLKGFDIALMSAGSAFSKSYARQIAEQGTIVIDNSSAWRMDPDVPLVVPEVNAPILKRQKPSLIANPNCSTIQLVISLNPLLKKFGIENVDVATYQSVSGAGQKGIKELSHQMHEFSSGKPCSIETFPQQIACNVIPAIDVFGTEGYSFEEEKMIRETRKILSAPLLDILATTVRVPTFHCHGEVITVKLEREASYEEILECFGTQSGLKVNTSNNYEALEHPVNTAGKRDVYISRIRLPLETRSSRRLQFWNIADNLKKGAATNAIQILQELV